MYVLISHLLPLSPLLHSTLLKCQSDSWETMETALNRTQIKPSVPATKYPQNITMRQQFSDYVETTVLEQVQWSLLDLHSTSTTQNTELNSGLVRNAPQHKQTG